jgi:protein-disulfide isomerase
MNQISEEYKNEVRFVIKMYPLPKHANAEISAESAMAALNQNKFFEFGDKLFAYQDAPGLSSRTQEQVATELNLDMTQWNKDRKSDQITKQIKWDQEDGRRAVLPVSEGSTQTASVDATPTFVFMKDDKILYKSNGMSVDEFRAKLDKLLDKAPKTTDPATSNPAITTPSTTPVVPPTIESK